MNENRKIVINLLPQSGEAWLGIALAVFFISCAVCIRGCTEAVTRQTEIQAQKEIHIKPNR